MSETMVTIERQLPGMAKKEKKQVTKTFYDFLNPEPSINGGWKLSAPEEVDEDHLRNVQMLTPASDDNLTSVTTAVDPKAAAEALGKEPLATEGKDTTPAAPVATEPAKAAAKQTRAPRTAKAKAPEPTPTPAPAPTPTPVDADTPAAEDLNRIS